MSDVAHVIKSVKTITFAQKHCQLNIRKRLMSSVVKLIAAAVGARGMEFDSRADKIGRIVANSSPPLQCFFGAVLPTR